MIKIENKRIEKNNKVFFIAEIGVNHCGKLSLAKKMVDKAKKAGADAVKFQTYITQNLATQSTKKVKYQLKNSSKKETHFQMLKSLELSKDNHKKLFKYCKKKKIIFLSTPYDKDSAKFLNQIGCSAFKTSSADIVDLELHEYLARLRKPVIISTGMSNLKEIKNCLNIYKKFKNNKIILLHCVSNYPCSYKSLNLKSISLLQNEFKFMVGYSDHSIGNKAAIISAALGAVVIEKHFTTNKSLPGPDQKTSITPDELKKIISEIHKTKEILGKYKKECQKEELEMKKISRKSLTLNRNIKKNQKILRKFLTLKRPGTGILFTNRSIVSGKYARKDLKKDHQIKLSDLKK